MQSIATDAGWSSIVTTSGACVYVCILVLTKYTVIKDDDLRMLLHVMICV